MFFSTIAYKCHLLITFANSLESDQAQKHQAWYGSKLDYGIPERIFFKKLILKKKADDKKKHEKLPSRQRVIIILPPVETVLKLEAISDSCLYKTKKGHDLIGCPQFFLLQFDNKDTADRILR